MSPAGNSSGPPLRRSLLVARAASGLALATGSLVMVGWALDIAALKSVLPELASMKANAALGFILCGGALALLAAPTGELGERRRPTGLLLAAAAGILGLLTLAEYVSEEDFGIDQLLARDTAATAFPGRMAPSTALCLTAVAAGLFCVRLRPAGPFHPLVAGLPATLAACVAGLALFGYGAGISTAYGWGQLTQMALHTAAVMLILAVGVIALVRSRHPTYPIGRALSLTSALLFVLLLGATTHATRRETVAAAARLEDHHAVKNRLEELRLALANVQLGSGGYVITGLPATVASQERAVQEVERLLREVRARTAQQPQQQSRLASAEAAAEALADWYRRLTDTRQREGFEPAQRMVQTGAGEALLADAQRLVGEMQGEEDRLRMAQEARFDQRQEETARLLAAGSVTTFLFVAAAGWMAQRDLGRRLRAEEELRGANDRLDARVRARTGELNRSVQLLKEEIEQRARAETALRESERRFRNVTETLPTLVWSCLPDGRCDYLGPQWVAYTGIPAEQQLDYGWAEQVHPEDRARTQAAWAEATATGGVFDVAFRIRRHDGVYRQFQTRAVPLRDAAGQIVKWFGTNTDTEELRQAVATVRESETLGRLATEAAQVGIWKWHLPTNRVSWDPQMFRLYGLEPTPEGRVDYSDWRQSVLPEDLPGQELVIQDTVARRGQSTREFRILRRSDGEIRDLHAVDTTHPGADGTVEWVVGTNLDITERKRTEESLRTSVKENADFKSALDEHALVAITDPRGKITFVNDRFCAISQYSREELIGQDHRLINSGHHPKAFIETLWQTIGAGRVWQGEIKNRAKDGSFFWVATTIVPFLDAAGRPRHYVAIRSDITERKAADEHVQTLNTELGRRVAQLEAANRELEAFSYSVSHDLRAPLRGIDGFARMLEESQAERLDADGRRRIAVIRGETKRMGLLIDSLLTFSRLGRQQLESSRVDLGGLTLATWSDLVRPAPERSAQLAMAPLPPACGDATLLRQVIANLLGNALKFTRHQSAPRIEVGGAAGTAEHTYFVRDNGAGFDARHAHKLFGVFQRLHRESEFEGNGVGLALAQRIINRHGGRIWAEGALGRGATFFFTLPASPPPPS